ncbi:MAG TPA: RDD family protein [Thermoanaerobaculia bacterium]|nr:RDD family protein [Thermoanaerobaculia bacterium]
MRRRERRVVTPELVGLRLTPAGPASRLAALLVDVTLILAGTAALDSLLGPLLPRAVSEALVVTLAFVLQWGYHVYFETWHRGRSPGKRATGLRVVDGRGLPLTLQQSFVRNILRALDFLPLFYGLGGLVSLLDPEGRRLGDLAADTLVVEERKPAASAERLRAERRIEDLAEASNLEVARRIRHRVGVEEREFLATLCQRADRLEPQARYDLMEQVGGYYRETLEIDAPHLSGENLVRGIAAVLFPAREGVGSPRR